MIQAIRASRSQLEKIYLQAYKRDLGICQLCDKPVSWEMRVFHHIVPKGRVRIDHLDNFALSHLKCHRLLHDGVFDFTIDEFIEMKKEQLGRFYFYNHVEAMQ